MVIFVRSKEKCLCFQFFNEIVGLDYDDCEYEAGDYEEIPDDAEHAEYGSIFDK